MAQITWVNFLHLYQPPRQEQPILKQVIRESYWPLVKNLKKYPRLKFTINITGCLLEALAANRYKSLIQEFKTLVQQKRLELVGSAMYHPILPLLPPEEIKRQIALQEQTLKKFFGADFKPQGFFPPEMAWGENLAAVLKASDYRWVILDEIAYNGKLRQTKPTIDYRLKDSQIKIIFRQRKISKDFVPRVIKEKLQQTKRQQIVVSATDGEMYGHWHKDRQKVFSWVAKNNKLETLTVSDFLLTREGQEEVRPEASSWETTPVELKRRIPYALWRHPKNPIHKNLWCLAEQAIALVNQHQQDANAYWARWHLDRGLTSCSFWWAARKKPSTFSPLTWHPDEIEKGALDLIRAIRSLAKVTKTEKIQAEKIYHQLKKNIWHKHWSLQP